MYPHNRQMNRYISFNTNKAGNDGLNVAFRVTLTSLTLGSCSTTGAPCRLNLTECDGDGAACASDAECVGHGGGETWSNLVCACARCNNKKGDRTPLEAGMKLTSTPKKPNLRSFLFHGKGQMHSTWRAYLKIG